MASSMVFTFIGADKPGLIQRLAHTVTQHGGNWLESRMSELAGQFAGIVQVAIAERQRGSLQDALMKLSGDGLTIVVAENQPEIAVIGHRYLHLRIVGNDRPGIVLEVASALAQRQINILEMDTHVTSAPMTAEALFEASAEIEVPKMLDLNDLNDHLDEISDELAVDIELEEALR